MKRHPQPHCEPTKTGVPHTMLVAFWLLLAITACAEPESPVVPLFEVSGRLEDEDILEASGLARSQKEAGRLWIINDNGAKEIVHAIDHTGRRLGEFKLKKSDNVDWEDLASFQVDGTAYLMIADIGDNDAKHNQRTLYFVEEPNPEKKGKEKLDWRVDYVYPDGARDAESAAIDSETQSVLILSKRDLPPRLYEVPLYAESEDAVTAVFLGTVNSLERPSRQDIEFAPALKDWYWQPVGMDFSADNRAAVILTYRAVYYYQRQAGQNWLEALNTMPVRVSIGNFENAESVAFGNEGRAVFVTGENKKSRVLRADFSEEAPK